MNILVYGAGVIGTLYAARLQEAGHRVTVLARAQRRDEIEHHGLLLENMINGSQLAIPVATIGRLAAEAVYDMALISVRRDQLAGVIPELKANRQIPTMLFLLNNPLGATDLGNAFGPERVLLGFPGAGGALEGPTLRYAMIAQQPTTVGELGGEKTVRLTKVVEALRSAGFPTRIEPHMDAWLKAHAFFETAVCAAIYLEGGDCHRLSRDREVLRLLVDGVCEGFQAVRALGYPLRPFSLKVLFNWMPRSVAASYWGRFFSTPIADYVFGRHARSAAGETQALANDCRALLDKSGVEAPALVQLYRAIDHFVSAGGKSGGRA
jgi:2-dehydropantoate 2-reductase